MPSAQNSANTVPCFWPSRSAARVRARSRAWSKPTRTLSTSITNPYRIASVRSSTIDTSKKNDHKFPHTLSVSLSIAISKATEAQDSRREVQRTSTYPQLSSIVINCHQLSSIVINCPQIKGCDKRWWWTSFAVPCCAMLCQAVPSCAKRPEIWTLGALLGRSLEELGSAQCLAQPA